LLIKKMSIFSKMIILIALLLLTVLLLYGRSNYVSVKVIEKTLKEANYDQLSFFVHQIDTTIRQLSSFTVTLNNDPDIMKFHEKFIESSYMNIDVIFQKERIMQKLQIQSLSATWNNELSLFSPSLKEVLSTNSIKEYDEEELKKQINRGWQVLEMNSDFETEFIFSYYTIEPYASIDSFDQIKRIIEIRFFEKALREALDDYKASGTRNPFFYHPNYGVIDNSDPNVEFTAKLIDQFQSMELDTHGIIESKIDHSPYFVTYIQSEQLDWYMVDYVAVEKILAPINESRNYFYLSIAILILLSLFAAFMLYKHVQMPVRELALGVRTIERGDYSARMPDKTSSDFMFLFNSFNRMADRIEKLIQSVLTERIRTTEAVLKQLQTQINPHFLFNCFALIMSMAKSNNKEAILSITHSLSKYYRYTTRSEVMYCKLEEEVSFIRHYLSIQQMRMPKLRYEVQIEESILEEMIPKLLIQPLVENAIVHGIESSLKAGNVVILGRKTTDGFEIIVEDDGLGMSRSETEELLKKIDGPLLEEMGCGLWNVNQRVVMMFDEGSSLTILRTTDDRTRIILLLKPKPRRSEDV